MDKHRSVVSTFTTLQNINYSTDWFLVLLLLWSTFSRQFPYHEAGWLTLVFTQSPTIFGVFSKLNCVAPP